MKKIISVVLMLTLVLSLAACGGGKDDIAKVGDSVRAAYVEGGGQPRRRGSGGGQMNLRFSVIT